jgi:flagellar biosynthesis anti-sigma factor FlgM
MHISNTQINKVMELHLHKVHAMLPSAGLSAASGVDRLTFSRQATEMHKIKQAMASLPDIRNEIVEGIRQKVSAGDYEVNESQLAQRMFTCAADGRLGN